MSNEQNAALAGHMPIDGTDLEVVAYVNAGGNLVLRVNKSGICVLDAGVAHATDAMSDDALRNANMFVRPVLRDLRVPDILDLTEAWARARK